MPKLTNTLLDLPENDDTIDCECDNGQDRDGNECYYCEGKGVISERYYNDTKELEQQEFKANE